MFESGELLRCFRLMCAGEERGLLTKTAIISRGLREFHAIKLTQRIFARGLIRLEQTNPVGESPKRCPHRYHCMDTAEVGCIEPF